VKNASIFSRQLISIGMRDYIQFSHGLLIG
jgi:hypothetical protein